MSAGPSRVGRERSDRRPRNVHIGAKISDRPVVRVVDMPIGSSGPRPSAVIDHTMSPGRVLRAPSPDRLFTADHLWGFGGLHGGLSLALLTGAMRAEAGAMRLRQTAAHFIAPVRREHDITTRVLRSGSATRIVAAEATHAGLAAAHADAIFGDSRGPFPACAPSAPDAGSPGDHSAFSLPTELVPIGRHLEIRPVGSARPFANGDEQELTAWVRLVEDDEPPDELRLIVLMDALAPAVTAAIAEIVAVPTIQLTVRPSVDCRASSSPWILLMARSHLVTPDGWADEQLDAWSADGNHIGTARQLRARTRAHPRGN